MTEEITVPEGFVGSAVISVALPPSDVMRLFTPEGERAWAGTGWDPQYAVPTRTAGAGAVFTTLHGGHETTWIMVDQEPDRVRYARMSPGALAGTVEVRVVGESAAGTSVCVTYDLTALSSAALTELDAFAAGFDNYIASWATDIAASLEPH